MKHGIAITPALVEDAQDKISGLPIKRYYLLTTAEPNMTDPAALRDLQERIQKEQGCEVIVNEVIPTLKYYLRLLPDPARFLVEYNAALLTDYEANTDLKETHLRTWQEISRREGFAP